MDSKVWQNGGEGARRGDGFLAKRGRKVIKMYPIEFEACDETDELLFRVKMFDEVCATVEIKTPVTVDYWDEVSAKIREALVAMDLVT